MRLAIVASCIGVLLGAAPWLAAIGQVKDQAFTPFRLVGEWTFVNSNTRQNFSGDVVVLVTEAMHDGVMRGTVSYDGRQNNDKCGTKALFVDKPTEAEITRTSEGYRLSFSVTCLHGQSPRPRSLTLVCEAETCTRPEILPHGQGALTLREQR